MANILKKSFSKDINKWLALIRLSEKEKEEKQPNWAKIDQYFRGTQWNKPDREGYSVVTVNLVYSTVKVIVPAAYLRYPKIFFQAATPVSVDACRLLERVLNSDMRKMKLKETGKRCVQDLILYGTAFAKTTFEVDEGYEEYQQNKDQIDQLLAEFSDMQQGNPNPERFAIPKARPYCIRVSPRDVNWAVGATDWEDIGFISHHAVKRVSTLKADKRYKNTKDLQPTSNIREDLRSGLGQFAGYGAEDYLDVCDVYEIWDIENQQWFTIADGHDKYLTDPEDNPNPYPHPFDRLITTPLEDQILGMSEIEPWLPQQDELNLLRTSQSNHNKRFNRKYAIVENSVSNEEELQKLESGEDGVIIKFRAGRPVRDNFAAIEDANMPSDTYRFNGIIEDDIVKISRTTPYRRGGVVGANTATEANLAESAAQLGDFDRVDAVGEFSLSILEKVRKARRAFTVGREILDITGNPLDLERWKYWTGDDIDIESQMMVEYGSTQPTNDQQRKQDALLVYDRAVANPTVNPQSAMTKLLEAFREPDLTSYFLPNELLQIQMVQKALGAAKEQKGVSPIGAGSQGNEPGPIQPNNTPAEVAGRAAPSNNGAA